MAPAAPQGSRLDPALDIHQKPHSPGEELLAVIARNPLASPPPFEKLVGDLAGAGSRRINIHHRLVYQVLKKERTVKVLRMHTHYEWIAVRFRNRSRSVGEST